MKYYVKQGETLDLICYRHYGQASGYVEQVLEANYRLSNYGVELPIGLEIELPELPNEKNEQKLVSLWN